MGRTYSNRYAYDRSDNSDYQRFTTSKRNLKPYTIPPLRRTKIDEPKPIFNLPKGITRDEN